MIDYQSNLILQEEKCSYSHVDPYDKQIAHKFKIAISILIFSLNRKRLKCWQLQDYRRLPVNDNVHIAKKLIKGITWELKVIAECLSTYFLWLQFMFVVITSTGRGSGFLQCPVSVNFLRCICKYILRCKYPLLYICKYPLLCICKYSLICICKYPLLFICKYPLVLSLISTLIISLTLSLVHIAIHIQCAPYDILE